MASNYIQPNAACTGTHTHMYVLEYHAEGETPSIQGIMYIDVLADACNTYT